MRMNSWIKPQDWFLEEAMTFLQRFFFSEYNSIIIFIDILILNTVVIYFPIKIYLNTTN